MIDILQTRPGRRAQRAVWDGTNSGELRLLAKKRLLRVEGSEALIRAGDGEDEHVVRMQLGWSLLAWFNGDPDAALTDPEVSVCSRSAWESFARVVPPAALGT